MDSAAWIRCAPFDRGNWKGGSIYIYIIYIYISFIFTDCNRKVVAQKKNKKKTGSPVKGTHLEPIVVSFLKLSSQWQVGNQFCQS